jgi:hemerythrin
MTPERFAHYMSGNKELDDEHFALLTEFDAVISRFKNNDPAAVQSAVMVLSSLKSHIAREEHCMMGLKYPFAQSHIDDHVKQNRDIQQLIDNKHVNDLALQLFLENVSVRFLDHIDHYDLQFTDWLKQKYGDIVDFNTMHYGDCDKLALCV